MTRIYIVLIIVMVSAIAAGSWMYSYNQSQIESLKLQLADAQSRPQPRTLTWLQYNDSPDLNFRYPEDFFVQVNFGAGTSTPIFIVRKGMIGQMEIWQGPPQISDLDHSPTESLTAGKYNVWMFYPPNDRETKLEMHKIFQSLKIN